MKYLEPPFLETLRCPGLTPAAHSVGRLLEELPKKLAVFHYKRVRSFLWVVFLGGTGTGKSTIFNTLCRKTLSEAGVERPKTFGPIVYLEASLSMEKGFPFCSMEVRKVPPEGAGQTAHSGQSGEILVIQHPRGDMDHLALVDTPDLDSLEAGNRQMVEDMYLLADVVVFVTSEEKYADEVPFQFLERIQEDGKPFLLLLNKAGSFITREEVVSSLRTQGLGIEDDRFFLLPYHAGSPSELLGRDEAFIGFQGTFSRMFGHDRLPGLLSAERRRAVRELSGQIRLLIGLLEQEREAAANWLEHLDVFFRAACTSLFQAREKHFSEESREYLQNEIRRLYSRYDLLGKPRRAIARVILTPLELLGFRTSRVTESHEDALRRIRRKIDMSPIQGAVEAFNRSVLEKLSPSDESSPLYGKLRDPGLPLTHEEIRKHVLEEQDRLALWLEQTFQRLAQGIPKSREWGIYSASILWGGLILSLEVAIGGGISIMEAVLDSAIAPFVTKGAVELFAYQELQGIARELGKRYQDGLVSVIRQQRDRYVEALSSLGAPQASTAKLHDLLRTVEEGGER